MVSNAAKHIPGFMEKKRNYNFRWNLIESAFHLASSSRSQTLARAVREARLDAQCPPALLKSVLRESCSAQKNSATALCSVVSDSAPPQGLEPAGSSVHGSLQAGALEWVGLPPPGELPDPGIKPASPAPAGILYG